MLIESIESDLHAHMKSGNMHCTTSVQCHWTCIMLKVHVGEMKTVALLVCGEWSVSLFITFFSLFLWGWGVEVLFYCLHLNSLLPLHLN